MSVETHDISDMNAYTSRMEMSVFDKLFWADKVFEPVDKIVDFGCGDGAVLDAYRHNRRTHDTTFPLLIAADNNPVMLNAARSRLGEEGVQYVNDIEELVRGRNYNDSLLLLNSVLHEVFSTLSRKEAREVVRLLFGANFKYIVIRDMATEDINRRAKIKTDKKYWTGYKWLCSHMAEQIADFERVWGPIRNKRDLIHFLLKYRYVENWDREVQENYLPLTVEDYLSLIPRNYKLIYADVFTHPFTKYAVERDTGIDLTEHTHVKLILRRKD